MTDTLDVDDIAPVSAPLDETYEQPKRRGRPPGSKNKTYAGKPVGTRGRGKASLYPQIRAFLLLTTAPLALIPALQRDQLDEAELEALARGIDMQAQTSPQFRKYLEMVLNGAGGVNLIGVVAVILARRALRHNLIELPDELGGNAGADTLLGTTLGALATGNLAAPMPVPEAT